MRALCVYATAARSHVHAKRGSQRGFASERPGAAPLCVERRPLPVGEVAACERRSCDAACKGSA